MKTKCSPFFVAILSITFLSISCLRNPSLSTGNDSDLQRLEAGIFYLKVNTSGLLAGNQMQLQVNSGENLTVSANGESQFSQYFTKDEVFNVAITSGSFRQNCVLGSTNGTFSSGDITVDVTCTTTQFLVGGNVTGLESGKSVGLQLATGEVFNVSQNGSFQFNTLHNDGVAWSVSVVQQPYRMQCNLTNASGTIAAADTSVLAVSCVEWGVWVLSNDPPLGAIIDDQDSVRIVFNRTMNTGSCGPADLTGSFSGATFSIATTNITNDTLVLNPNPNWPIGIGRESWLSTCQSMAGENFADGSIRITYTVVSDPSNLRYVSTSGSDANPGTLSQPLANLETAYSQLVSLGTCSSDDCIVLMAAGDYTTNFPLNLQEGISILGSYSSDFSTWEPWNKTTRILPAGGFVCGSPTSAAPCAMFRANSISNPFKTALSGLMTQSPNEIHTAAVHLQDSCIFMRHLNFRGGEANSSTGTSRGLFVSGAASLTCDIPEMQDVLFSSEGCTGLGCQTYGMAIYSRPNNQLRISGSLLAAGYSSSSSSSSFGLLLDYANPDVYIERTTITGNESEAPVSAVFRYNGGTGGDVEINASIIEGGRSGGPNLTGISITGAGTGRFTALNSMISAGSEDGSNTNIEGSGIRYSNAGVQLRLANNIITGGDMSSAGSASIPVLVYPTTFSNGAPEIINNILYSDPSAPVKICIADYGTAFSAGAALLLSNDFITCNTGDGMVVANYTGASLAFTEICGGNICQAGGLNPMNPTTTPTGNISIMPVFIDTTSDPPDFRHAMDGTAPCSVTQGGIVHALSTNATSTLDSSVYRNGSAANWSMGPHQWDGACAP